MYFVVYIIKLKRYVVVPSTWIFGFDEQLEKFVNYSLNRSQNFLCYYTTNEDAFIDGCPNAHFEPNFNVMVDNINSDGSFDGGFIVKLKRCKSECKLVSSFTISNLKKKKKIFLDYIKSKRIYH